jgi:type IV pilus assembly protein PilE
MNANRNKLIRGFTLIEAMIVLVIIAILLGLAYPSYVKYVRKANRGEAQQLLMNWSINQEIFRSNNSAYTADGGMVPANDKYTFAASNTGATTFTLTATARSGSDQENDTARDSSIPCAAITLDQNGQKLHAACWE